MSALQRYSPLPREAMSDAVNQACVRSIELLSRISIRGSLTDCEALVSSLGFSTLPSLLSFNSNSISDLLALGPDEWLLISSKKHEHASNGFGMSIVDVSDRQCAIEVSGSAAASLISAGCALDLRASAFLVGRCTRTLLGRSEIILMRKADRDGHRVYLVEVWRSYAIYVWQFLATALRDL